MNKLPFFHLIKKSCLVDAPSPLLIMAHGYGSNENDLFSFSRNLPDKLTIVSIRGDINIQNIGYAWYDINIEFNGNKTYDIEKAIESRDKVADCIEKCTEIYNTDKNNVTLLGFSQGSILVNAVALTYPEKVKNVIAFSGVVDPNIINLSSKSLKNLSFYISHGTLDEVLPYNLSKESLKFLEKNNLNFVFEDFPVGHGVSPENFKSMLSWLTKKLV
ncbi:MAG: alpha/beta fold hydrolase [Flavobacteriaceae bacterium]|nr:alpha/beta fold hydrolase [Flavobacteriaceae bacterium]MBT5856868.1 alpha/beta fold hydrolase [Flavobacteriaceae bacterium]